tara:strand:+ start:716 stop:991 length:276 start_codon:yes stop_codon:yes gene_type:complete
MALIPNGTRVIVQRKTAETETAGGILIPGAEEKKLNEGVIVAVGPDCKEYMANGEYVIFDAFAGKEVHHDGEDYAVLDESDIVVFVREASE